MVSKQSTLPIENLPRKRQFFDPMEVDGLVRIEELGLCEHCEELLFISDMPSDAMDAQWRCHQCNGVLTHKSFGYESSKGGRKLWVSPNSKWTETRPTEDFLIKDWVVDVGEFHTKPFWRKVTWPDMQ